MGQRSGGATRRRDARNGVALRTLSRYQIGALLKERGLRQKDIARLADVSVGWVNLTIAGKTPDTTTTRRIWRELEAALMLTPAAPQAVAT